MDGTSLFMKQKWLVIYIMEYSRIDLLSNIEYFSLCYQLFFRK
jgi:hypothetical protein